MIPIQLEEIFTQTEGHLLVICAEAGSGLKKEEKKRSVERLFRFTCANKEISFLTRIYLIYKYSPPSLVRDQSIFPLFIPHQIAQGSLIFTEIGMGLGSREN